MKRKTAGNNIFEIGRVSFSADRFVVTESFVLRIKICAKNPALRAAAKRQLQYRSPINAKTTFALVHNFRTEALAYKFPISPPYYQNLKKPTPFHERTPLPPQRASGQAGVWRRAGAGSG